MLSLFPSFKFRSVTDITAEFLNENGITTLLLDVDNTIAPYGTLGLSVPVIRWASGLMKKGVTLFIVSNSKKSRPEVFAAALGIGYIKAAKKPSPKALIAAMERLGVEKGSTALVGDQIYTDMIASSLAGVTGILIRPIMFTNPFLAIRTFFELPFRHQTGRKRVS